MPDRISVPLSNLNGVSWGLTRRGEPVTFGFPLPEAAARSTSEISVDGPAGPVPVQARALDLWPDGSIRWALIDTRFDTANGRAEGYSARVGDTAVPSPDLGLRVVVSADGIRIATGIATFDIRVGGAFPLSDVAVGDARTIDGTASGLFVEHEGRQHRGLVTGVTVREQGPLRADIDVSGTIGAQLPLDVFARVEVFAQTATVRLAVTLRNHRRAEHVGGQWPLGDPGSVLLTSARLVFALAHSIDRVRCAPEPGAAGADVALPFAIHQESSGADVWDGPIHRNRDGRVPLRYRGYELREAGRRTVGRRASPVVVADSGGREISVAIPQFWENFPQAIALTSSALSIDWWPAVGDVHELQGGEQKTHRAVIAFAPDTVSSPPLAWVHDPLSVYPAPDWCCGSGVVPFLVPEAVGSDIGYLSIVRGGLDPEHGFLAKRELADEYGWRNFGDLHADHESAFQPPGQRVVSHYNNQYDAVAAFALHFLRTGDSRWWRLCDDLARHVTDIDIYRTTEDKSAYNGGLFWHTNHYTDAGTATHRTYPRGGKEGGGPSAEHNYNAGLMLHYFMTGDRQSRDAAIGLGRWVILMEDGRLTPLRRLASGSTGLASATGSMTYHGPGRAAANSILACLVALRLTGDSEYLAMAETLIQRCVHPDENLEALNLLDVERRWYYTVFLQAVGVYLQFKEERDDRDAMFSYAQASLLHYARWMSVHERPYLSRPDVLEFPNETWPAQDMRKADVFGWAALHAEGAERQAFIERAAFFFRYSVETLQAAPGRFHCRPLVLMLSNGWRYAWLTSRTGDLAPPPSAPQLSAPVRPAFVPQKVRAMRRVKWIAAVAAVVITALAAVAALR
ncbi:MAG TPA: hypothetical protein VFV78_06520 [Vicinamibacterales bacterium]|nr:hypothetical protein [Vicinamibacterales bacterium]